MSDTETVEVEPRANCLCGCDQTPKHKKSKFMPGHDAQLKASLYVTVRDESLSEDVRHDAREKLDSFGWPQPAPKRARKAKVKANGEAAEGADSGEVTAEDL